jgi:hypothetical protein
VRDSIWITLVAVSNVLFSLVLACTNPSRHRHAEAKRVVAAPTSYRDRRRDPKSAFGFEGWVAAPSCKAVQLHVSNSLASPLVRGFFFTGDAGDQCIRSGKRGAAARLSFADTLLPKSFPCIVVSHDRYDGFTDTSRSA